MKSFGGIADLEIGLKFIDLQFVMLSQKDNIRFKNLIKLEKTRKGVKFRNSKVLLEKSKKD